MDCNISEQKFYKLKGKPWNVLDWPYNESERSPPDIGHESSKRGSKEYMDNLLPGSMKRLYGGMPALETLAIARCPACSYICKVQCLPAHYKCDRNRHLVCRTSDLILDNGEVSREKSCGPFYEISWNKCKKKLTEVIEQSKSIAPVPKQKDMKSHSSRSHSTYVESERSSHSKSKSSSHSSSSNRDKEKSSKSSTVHRSSSSSSRSKSGHNSHKKDKHKSASGSSSSHSKRRDEKSVEIDGSSSKSKSSSSKDRHERTSKSRSEKSSSSSSKDRSEKSSSSKDRSEKSSSSKDRSEKSSSKDKSDKHHSSRDRSEKSSSSSWSKSSKSSTKVNPSQGSYTLSIPSSDTGQNETVESLLFSNSVIGGPPNQVMKIIATSTGSDKNKGDKTEYEQLKFYADSTDRRSKLASESDRHDNSTATGNSTSFKIPLKSKASSSSSVNLNNDSYVKKGKPSLKPSESYISVKSPSKSPSGNSVRSSGVESGRSNHSIPNSGANDQDALDGKINDSKSKLTSVTSHASNGSFKILLQGKSGSPTHVTQGHHDSTKKNRSLSKPLEKAPTKPLHKSSIPLASTETKSVGVAEPNELEKQNAALKSSSVTHVKKKKKKKEKDGPRKIIPLKERSFNPDLHCGVHITGDSRPCTRSLTCKTHSIALRRAVAGRSNPFDVLLQAHRKARDEEKNAKSETTDDKLKSKKSIQNGAESVATNSSVEVIRDVTTHETLSLDKSSKLNSNDKGKMTSSLSMPALDSSDVVSRLQAHRTDSKVDGINSQTFPLGRTKLIGAQQPRDMLAGSISQLPISSVPQTNRTDLTLKDYLDTKSSWSEASSESSSQNNSVVSTDNLRKLTNSESNADGWSEAAWENTGEHDSDIEIISSLPANNLDDNSWRRSIPQQTTEKEPRTASELFQARNRQNARAVSAGYNNVGSNQERSAQAVKYLTPACTIAHANWVSIYDHNLRHLKSHMAEYARTCGCYSGRDPDPSQLVYENTCRPGTPTDGISLFDIPMDSAENNFVYITDCKPGRRARIPRLYRPKRATLRLHNSEGEEIKEPETIPDSDLIYSKKNEEVANQIVYLDLRNSTSMDADVMIVGEVRRSGPDTAKSRKRPLHPVDVPLAHKRLTDDTGKIKTSVINIPASFPEYFEIPLYDESKHGSPREGWTSSRVFLPDERAQTEVHSATQALAIRTLKSFIEKPLENSDIFYDSNNAWLPDAYDHTTMIPKS